jgi:DNA polymerase I-like protein with 3'-5' exonuclease and polymerase domains
MSFKNFIRDSFERVLAVDSEFRYADDSFTIQDQVVCFVYKDIFTGDVFSFWEADKESSTPHFEWRNVLLIPFVAVAEGHSWLSLLHGKPTNVWDTYVENARLYKTMRIGKGALNLLNTAHGYGINETMTKDQKDEERKVVYENKTYTPQQRKRILKYCLDDVELTEKVFLKQLEDIEKKNKLKTNEDYKRELTQIMFRGASQLNVAQVERNGIPFDNDLVNEFNLYWPKVKLHLIKKYNQIINVFDENGIEKNKLFQDMVRRNGLFDKWPRTFKTGELVKDKKVIEKFSFNKEIKIYQKIKYFLNLTELSMFKPGRDRKMRTSFNMFGTETGRCTPSTRDFVFSGSGWVRNFIKPSWGNWCAYLDYSQQEVAIQGYLSGDKKLLEVYRNGDVYINTAKILGLVPDCATEESHPVQRGICKTLFLAQGYGAGPGYVKNKIGCSMIKARHYLRLFKRIYRTYDNWINNQIKLAAINGKMTTVYGWQRYLTGKAKIGKDGKLKSIKNSLLNFPIQATGSEVLRMALIELNKNHFTVNATVHDAFLISIPINEFDERLEEAKKIMVTAAERVVGPIRVGAEIIRGNFKQKPEVQKDFDEIFNEIQNYKTYTNVATGPTYTEVAIQPSPLE